MGGFERFLSELKRRHVYRVAVVYAVSALAVVEAADLIVPRLGLSDSVVTVVLVIALLGLPLALVLAWAYEATPEGVVRDDAPSEATAPASRGTYVVAATTLALVAAVGWWLLTSRSLDPSNSAATASARSNSVAVLPFRDVSPEGDQAWFGAGLAEEIHAALTRVPDLDVVARQSAFSLADAGLEEIGDRLGVTHVLSGTQRIEGDRARIRAQLTVVDGARSLWSRDFQPRLDDVRDAQEEIARAVVDALEVELGPVPAAGLMEASTSDPVAHEHYLRGLQLWNRRSEPDVLSAIAHFGQAVELDSTYAAAWAGLAYSYLVLPEYSPTADVERVRERSDFAADRALAIDPDQPDALTAKGWGRMIHHFDWQGAEDLIARALARDPTNVNALHWKSHVLSWQGRRDEALALARRAVELDPLSPIMRQNLAFILMEAREYDAALRELDRVRGSAPTFVITLRTVWNIQTRAGRYEEASEALESWLIRTGRDPDASARLADEVESAGVRFGRMGQPGTLSRELVERVQPGLEIAGQLYASVGDAENTLEVLEQAYRERAGARSLLSVRVNPLYDFLRGDQHFEDLLVRIGLAGD